MKHFDKVVGVTIQLTMPKEWGKATTIVEKVTGESLHDKIWNGLDYAIRVHLPVLQKDFGPASPICAISDETSEFDINTFRFHLHSFVDANQLEKTIDWLDDWMHDAYNRLDDRQRKLAKPKKPKKAK